MNSRIGALVGLSAVALLGAGSLSFAAEESTPPMHMHSPRWTTARRTQKPPEYKSEATQLHEKAEHHRKLAAIYQDPDSPEGRRQLRERCAALREVSEVLRRRGERS